MTKQSEDGEGIPPFKKDGYLPEGIHHCSQTEFVKRFCVGKHRSQFAESVRDLFGFGLSRNAEFVLFGGSFISVADEPHDLDCVLVFSRENDIPERTERLSINGTSLDIFFGSQEQEKVLQAFVEMFSNSRHGHRTGIVAVPIRDGSLDAWNRSDDFDQDTLDIVRRAYVGRHFIDKNNSHKALITIHGIKSYADWNAEIAHIASSNGWIFAPFTYGHVGVTTLAAAKRRKEIVEKFRLHINDIFDRYHCHVSVIAHSFGTYVIGKYLLGFDVPPVSIDTLILTGSILNENLALSDFEGRAAVIVNEVAPNDAIVKFAAMGTGWSDPLVGRSGDLGFQIVTPKLEQRTCEIFNHNNVIRRDVVSKRWMPILESNVGRGRSEATKEFIRKEHEKMKKNGI